MGNNNIRGLQLLETIYPPEDGKSCIPPEKLQAAIKKGLVKPPDPSDVQDLDDDLDAKIDASIKEVWSYYDKKNVGFLDKKQTHQFINDALEVFALRKNRKVKELFPPGGSVSKALDEGFKAFDRKNTGRVTFADFEEFINENDADEVLAIWTGNTGPLEVKQLDPSKLVDPKAMAAESQKTTPGHIQLRNYDQ
eukprot:TRINITY_DN2874_c0_g1_i1.p1 TRINITY_DN2874_c0_g1~~TRINITY_DN2874_c0_g1_i1.p1  ORF type:complete len:194 (+),score=56.04 TRINITY_DN2874_c0_g1_i1:110-691(+)